MTSPVLATPKRGWNDRGFRAGVDGAPLDRVRALAAEAAVAGEEFARQVWVGYRAARGLRGGDR